LLLLLLLHGPWPAHGLLCAASRALYAANIPLPGLAVATTRLLLATHAPDARTLRVAGVLSAHHATTTALQAHTPAGHHTVTLKQLGWV
jgi:hypothetical protein